MRLGWGDRVIAQPLSNPERWTRRHFFASISFLPTFLAHLSCLFCMCQHFTTHVRNVSSFSRFPCTEQFAVLCVLFSPPPIPPPLRNANAVFFIITAESGPANVHNIYDSWQASHLQNEEASLPNVEALILHNSQLLCGSCRKAASDNEALLLLLL